MNREVFLARVRAATGGRPPEALTDSFTPSAVSAQEADVVGDMARQWQRPLAAWYHVAPGGAARTVAEILRRGGLRRIALSAHPLLGTLGIPQALQEIDAASIPLSATRGELHSALAGADAGITVAAYAVAETGTLVEHAGPEQPRGISLLPPVHIALVRAGDLLPRLDDLFAALGREPLGSGTVFISGPSGTGDIGLQHVTGVHGPREVHLVVVDEAVGSAGPPGA